MSSFCEGSPDAEIMLVGMAPGREELAADSPFVGGSGRLLWSMMKKANLDRSQCYILNTIGEWPEGKTGGPTPEQYDRWWERFDAAARDFRGRIVVLLGGDALWRYTGLSGGIEAWRGYIVTPSECERILRVSQRLVPYKDGKTLWKSGKHKGEPHIVKVKEPHEPPLGAQVTQILPTLHPSGVLRSGLSTLPLLLADLRRAARARNGTLLRSRTHYFTSPIIRSEDEIAVDIETGGATADFSDITRIGIADSRDAWTRAWSPETAAAARAVLNAPDTLFIIHNAAFDVPRLGRAGAPVMGRLADTMLGAALLQPDLPKGLNACASMYLDCGRWKHLSESDPERYNALDAIREFELWQQEKALLAETGQLGLFLDTIMGAVPSLIRMSSKGLYMDAARRDAWVADLERQGMAQVAEWQARSGGVNYSSPKQLKDYFRRLGMELKLNKYGAESTDKESLARLMAEYPVHKEVIQLLLDCRHTFKELETYAKVAASEDGAVHASFLPSFKDADPETGKGLAGTWRITAKEPNLQNQPQSARRMYVPRPGYVFVGADYSQLEARILAAASGDAALLDACEHDIHNYNAARLGVDKTRAKNGFYGWSYLAGERTLYNTFIGKGFKVPLAECRALLDGFDREFKVAAAFRQQIIAAGQAKRYVENPFGLRRYFPQREFPAPAAVSTWVQSSAAIMMWRIIPELDAAMRAKGGSLLVSVHDDVLCEVPAAENDNALLCIREIMEQRFPQIAVDFRAPVGLKWSDKSWGEMEEWRRE